jgi:solute:Na+ symporter, SSS family
MPLLDWAVIGLYFAFLLGALAFARRAKNMEEFAVGGRSLPAGIVFATLTSTFIGPGYSMGLANNAAQTGLIWVAIFFAFSLQTVLIGRFVAPRLRSFEGALTLGDIMGYRYGRLVKLLAGILSVALTAGFVGVIARASGEIIAALTPIPFIWAVILSTALVIGYSTWGGIKTVVLTDVLQFILLAVITPIVVLFIVSRVGAAEADAHLSRALGASSGIPPVAALGLVLGFLLGETLIPPYTNRALMSRDAATAGRAFVMTGAFSVAWFIVCGSIGVLGAATLPPTEGNLFIATLRAYLPAGMLGLAVTALVSIVMSSQSSLLNAASVSFTRDVAGVLRPGLASANVSLAMMRWLNLAIGVGATVFALNVPGIIDALLYCYTLWAPTVVLPLIVAALRPGVKPLSGLAAIVAGGAATALWEWWLATPGEVPSLLVGVAANQVAFWTVELSSGRWAAHESWLRPLDASPAPGVALGAPAGGVNINGIGGGL